jgi:hypothetical protein
MSRSYKKTSVIGYTCASSEKSDKKHAHKVYRKHVKNNISSLHGDVDKLEELIMPIEEELSNTWLMSKDGKHYVNIDGYIDDDRVYKIIKKCLRK